MEQYKFPGQHTWNGMILEGLSTVETIQALESFEMLDGEVLIASYPKAGQTWVEEVTWLILNNGDFNAAKSQPLYQRGFYLEYKLNGITSGLEEVQKSIRPCMMKTHLKPDTFRQQIDTGNVKIIVVIRNPKDVLVSFYNFYRMNRNLGNFTGTWNDFFEMYKAKGLLYGDYFDWYKEWLKEMHKPNVFIIKFEDMKKCLPNVLRSLCKFMGKTFSEDLIGEIVNHVNFENMKENEMTNYSSVPIFDMQISPFMRKGQIGDWKNYFDEEQSELVNEEYEKHIVKYGISLQFD